MKQFILFSFLLFSLGACKKDSVLFDDGNDYLKNVQAFLKDSMQAEYLYKMDFAKAVQSTINNDTGYLRIPLKGKGIHQEFVLLHTNGSGKFSKGRIVVLDESNPSRRTGEAFNGSVTIRYLPGELAVQSSIVNGYIVGFHRKPSLLRSGIGSANTKEVMLVEAPTYKDMPEVVVIGYRQFNRGTAYSDWINLQSFFGGGGGGSGSFGSGYYGSIDGNGGGGNSNSFNDRSSGGRASTKEVSIKEDPPILIDFEEQKSNPAIEIEAYLRCFATIPDAGAVCSIEIFSDIPVDKDPNKLFNWQTESPGHTFLQIKKSNGNQSIIQNIGFYPRTNWKSILTPGPIAGKFVDNGDHEFNASLQMNITPAQLQLALTRILYLAKFIRYDIDEYNCTDFTLDVFNEIRHPANKLKIPRYGIPGGMAPEGTNTPQGLYNKLKSMKASGDAEASNISIPGYKGWVANSSGPCN